MDHGEGYARARTYLWAAIVILAKEGVDTRSVFTVLRTYANVASRAIEERSGPRLIAELEQLAWDNAQKMEVRDVREVF